MGVMSDGGSAGAGGCGGGTERAQDAQQFFGALDGLRVGAVEPIEAGGVLDAQGMKEQNDFRQVAALNFRSVALGAVEVAAFGPKPVADAGRGAAGPAGALLGGGAADRFDQQGADAALGVVAGDARQAAVNHMDNAVDGDGGFGDVGGDDDFAQTDWARRPASCSSGGNSPCRGMRASGSRSRRRRGRRRWWR